MQHVKLCCKQTKESDKHMEASQLPWCSCTAITDVLTGHVPHSEALLWGVSSEPDAQSVTLTARLRVSLLAERLLSLIPWWASLRGSGRLRAIKRMQLPAAWLHRIPMWQPLQAPVQHQQTAAVQIISGAGPGPGVQQQTAAAKGQKLRWAVTRQLTWQLTWQEALTARDRPVKVLAYSLQVASAMEHLTRKLLGPKLPHGVHMAKEDFTAVSL